MKHDHNSSIYKLNIFLNKINDIFLDRLRKFIKTIQKTMKTTHNV